MKQVDAWLLEVIRWNGAIIDDRDPPQVHLYAELGDRAALNNVMPAIEADSNISIRELGADEVAPVGRAVQSLVTHVITFADTAVEGDLYTQVSATITPRVA